MPQAYCTADDVRRALREADLPGDATQDPRIVTDAIHAQTEKLEKRLSRHWYAEENADILEEAEHVTIPESAKTRDDEHSLPTHGATVHGASEWDKRRSRKNSDALLESGPSYERRRKHLRRPKQAIRIATGRPEALEPPIDESVPAYTRITFDRRDVQELNELHVVGADGSYTDWVDSNDYDGGVGNEHRGKDYWARINNGGVSELYIDVHALDDDIPTLANAVYVDIDYGHEGIPWSFRRAVAFRAAADLTEEAAMQIPENATVYGAESKAQELREQADDLLAEYEVEL